MNGSGYTSKCCGTIEVDLQSIAVVNEDLTSTPRGLGGLMVPHGREHIRCGPAAHLHSGSWQNWVQLPCSRTVLSAGIGEEEKFHSESSLLIPITTLLWACSA